jgi:hypothetical protein
VLVVVVVVVVVVVLNPVLGEAAIRRGARGASSAADQDGASTSQASQLSAVWMIYSLGQRGSA